MAGPAGSAGTGAAAAAAPPPPPPPSQAPPQPSANASLGLLGLLPLLVLIALGVSLALGRPPLLVAWPACTHLVEEKGTATTAAAPPPVLNVPVFLTQADSDADARLAALSALKRAREAYRTELVVRMKALERMALDRLPEWRGHARRPLLTAALQARVWEGEGGLRAWVPECWEANERVLDRLLRLPEVTVGLPMKVKEGPSPSPLPEQEQEEDEEPPRQPAGDCGSSRSGIKGYSDGVQVLTHLLRDWAKEGQEVRRRTYGPILRAVGRLFPRKGARILVPGAGLGRLAFELAYGGGGGGNRVTALDVSPVMVAATASVLRLVLKEEDEEEDGGLLRLYPFVHDPLINQRSHAARFRSITCPDPEARRQAERARRNRRCHQQSALSLEVGDLLALADAQPGAYDAVATCFFVDTGKHPLDYLWAVHRLLRSGGYWVNIGPLNYHRTLLDGAVQLTLEELDFAAAEMGLAPQRGWDLVPEPCAYRPEPFSDAEAASSAFLRSDVYAPAFGVYRKEG